MIRGSIHCKRTVQSTSALTLRYTAWCSVCTAKAVYYYTAYILPSSCSVFEVFTAESWEVYMQYILRLCCTSVWDYSILQYLRYRHTTCSTLLGLSTCAPGVSIVSLSKTDQLQWITRIFANKHNLCYFQIQQNFSSGQLGESNEL